MEDEIVLLQGFDENRFSNPFMSNSVFGGNFGFNNAFNRLYIDSITGQRASEVELDLLSGTEFDYNRRRSSVSSLLSGRSRTYRSEISREVTARAVSLEDFNRIMDFNIFEGDRTEDISDIELTESTFKRNRVTGETARIDGEALSRLDEQDLEQIASVFEARQAQILGSSLSPGLQTQSFSLLGDV